LDRAGKPIVVPDSGIVLSRKLAELLQVSPGDTVRIRPLIARREEIQTPVAATVETFLGLSAYADREFLSRLIGEYRVANSLLGVTFTHGLTGSTLLELRRRPAVVGISERLHVFSQIQETFGETMNISFSVMILFAGLIAFGSVLNTALVSLSERQREIGTLRVLGYTVPQVSRIISGESYLLNGIGIALGLVVGVGLSHAIARAYSTELYRFPAVIHPVRFVHTTLIMLAFITAAQLIVFRLIRRFNWLEVLKVKE
jgi:putative ABC transport system permease protein